MITKSPIGKLRRSQLGECIYPIEPMNPPFTREKASVVKQVLDALTIECVISRADGSILVNKQPGFAEATLRKASLTEPMFATAPLENRVEALEEFMSKAKARIVRLEGECSLPTK